MPKLIRDNFYFFIPFGLFLIIGAFFLITIETGDFLFYFSENRTASANLFFRYFTKVAEEPLYIILILSLLFVRIRLSLLILILGLSVSLLSFSSKKYFGHLRPKNYLERTEKLDELNPVPGINMHIGRNSFPSGHTMSAFAVFTLLTLMVPRKKYLGFIFCLLAILSGIARVYLCQHFLKDIYLGAILGTALALFIFYIQQFFPIERNTFPDNNLQSIFTPSNINNRV